MWPLKDILILTILVEITIVAFFLNLFLIQEKQRLKSKYKTFTNMTFIKAKDLMSGDIFKVNPRLPKEHWADTVIHKFNHVQIVTWGRTTLSMKEDDLVFLIRSTNPERNGKK
jgi:hypothetical protein